MTESCYLVLLLLLHMSYGHYISIYISYSCRNSTHFCCVWMVERIVFRFYSNWIEIKSQTIVCVYQFFEWGRGMGLVDFGIFLLSFHSSNSCNFGCLLLLILMLTIVETFWLNKRKKKFSINIVSLHISKVSHYYDRRKWIIYHCLLDFWWCVVPCKCLYYYHAKHPIISLIPNYWNIWCVNSFIYSVVSLG